MTLLGQRKNISLSEHYAFKKVLFVGNGVSVMKILEMLLVSVCILIAYVIRFLDWLFVLLAKIAVVSLEYLSELRTKFPRCPYFGRVFA